MMNSVHRFLAFLGFALLGSLSLGMGETVKVFILAGQSNMQGHGRVEGDSNHNEGKGSLSYLAENDEKYKSLRKGSGSWAERDDVSIWYLGRKGKLAPGYGARDAIASTRCDTRGR